MHSRKLRDPIVAVNHVGRGNDPMIEVGNTTPDDALNTTFPLLSQTLRLAAQPMPAKARQICAGWQTFATGALSR